MFATAKISHRILWGYSVPILLSISAAILVSVYVRDTTEKSTQVESAHAVVEGSKDLAYSIAGMQRSLRGYLLEKNDITLANYDKAEKQFNELIKILPQQVKEKQQQEKLARILELGTTIQKIAAELFPLVDRGQASKAIQLWKDAKTSEIAAELDRLVNEFAAAENSVLEAKKKAASQSLQLLSIVVSLSALMSVLFAIVLGIWLTSKLKQNLQDTIGVLASSSREIAATVEQQERVTAQQSISVNQTTTTMDELGSSSQKSAEQAAMAAKVALQALTLTEGGNKTVEQTLEGMARLKEKVGAIAEQITRLSEQTNQIGNISGVVTDLANQTNMLALNASVEAVRAGEHGKGFSVVATEIRKLAEQSKKSADKINNLVSDIQKAISATVTVTDEGIKTVEEGANFTQQTAKAFEGVANSINDMAQNNQQIYLTAQQQAVAIQQVVEAMNALNQTARETTSGITQTKVSTQQLNQAAQDLQVMV